MDQLLLSLPTWLLAVLFVGASCLFSVGLTAAVRRFIVGRDGEHHHEVLEALQSAGAIFAAIVVALAFFVVWDHQTKARQAEADEGAALISLYQDAQTLPQPGRAEVESAIRAYTTSVVRDDLPGLAMGESNDRTERSLSQMNAAVHRHLAATTAPDKVNEVAQSQYQLALASGSSMPPLLWALLLGACVLMLLMAAPLFKEDVRHHTIGSILLGATLGSTVFFVLMADHTFTGPLQINPSDLAQNLHTYAVMDSEISG